MLEELNVKKITYTSDKSAYDVHLQATPNHQMLGAKYKSEFKKMADLIKVLLYINSILNSVLLVY